MKINPDPAGDGSVRITFINDTPGGPSTDVFINAETANAFEAAVLESGVSSVNVNSTTGRLGANKNARSAHPRGRAVDVNKINGERVDSAGAKETRNALQDAFANQANVQDNFGPNRLEKTVNGKAVIQPNSGRNWRIHLNHLHFGTKPLPNRVINGLSLPQRVGEGGSVITIVPEYP